MMLDRKPSPAAPTTVGAYEAKTKFSELIARAEKGESFVVTKNGRPIACLTPATAPEHDEARAAGERILARFDARARGEFDFDSFWQELKQEDDERAERWL
jgi:prevent-host-death family protein